MANYDKLPLFPLHAVLFPHVTLPLHIFEERYRQMVAHCLKEGEPFAIVLLEHGSEVDRRDGIAPELFKVGTLARIDQAELLDDGRFYISVRGVSRVRIDEIYNDLPYLTGKVRRLWEQSDDPLQLQPLFDCASGLFRDYVETLLSDTKQRLGNLQLPQDAALLSYAIGASLQVTLLEKQRLLEAGSPGARLQIEIELLQREREAHEFCSAEEAAVDAEGNGDETLESGGPARRTIHRVDSSYSQYFFSKN